MSAEILRSLPPEVIHSLGPWVDRIALALGPLRARTRRGTGTPDGYEGLARRGPLDRLTLSEWALAEAVPDEFVRRAAMDELGYYQLARREEAQARTSVALFDPGPMQLGAPRLAQFATLLALSQRAEAAGARFGWSTLQRPPQQHGDEQPSLRLGADLPALRDFLRGRLAFAPTPDDLAAWLTRAEQGGWEDLWIVGAPATLPPGRRLHQVRTPVGRIEITEVVTPGERALDLTVARGGHHRTLRLPRPPEALCIRLLHGDLGKPAAPVPTRSPARPTPEVLPAVVLPAPEGPVFLLADGHKVAWRDATHTVTVLNVPDVPSARRPWYRRHGPTPDRRVVALGWCRRRLLIVTATADGFCVEDSPRLSFPSGGARIAAPSLSWVTEPGAFALGMAAVCPQPRTQVTPTVCFLDGHRRLVVLTPEGVRVSGPGVLALQAFPVCVESVLPEGVAAPEPRGDIAGLRVHPVTASATGAMSGTSPGVVATLGPEGWQYAETLTERATVRLPVGDEVLGMAPWPAEPGIRTSLLVLRDDRRTLVNVSSRGVAARLTLDQPAEYAHASARGDRVAFALRDGRVEVWSTLSGQRLVRTEPKR